MSEAPRRAFAHIYDPRNGSWALLHLVPAAIVKRLPLNPVLLLRGRDALPTERANDITVQATGLALNKATE